MKAAILFSFIVSAIAIQCPIYECGTVPAGVCAQINSNSSILLNQNGCPNGQACNLTQVWDPIGAIPAENVQCVPEEQLDTNPLKLLNITEFLMPLLNQSNIELQPEVSALEGNVTGVQANVTGVQANVTGVQGNVTGIQANVTGVQGNATGIQANVTAAEGTNATTAQEGIPPASVNITTNATGTTVETNATTVIANSTSGGGGRRLQGGRGGVGPPAGGAGPTTVVNVTTVAPVNATTPPSSGAPPAGQPNATLASPANVTTPITAVNVTTVPPLANATAGQPGAQPEAQPGAQPSPPQPSGPANVTAVPISGAPNATVTGPQAPNATATGPQAPNVTAPGPQAPTPTPPTGPTVNQTAGAPSNATLTPTNVTAIQPSENITSTGQENITSVAAGILQAQNQTAPSGQSTATLQNTPVISTNNATNTTELDVSNIAQVLSQYVQQNESGYNVAIPGVGFISIQSQEKKISCVIAKNRDLASGTAPFECNTDADCLLQDGTFATCICGMDGKSYCKPDYYDSEFSAFTDQCKNGEMDQEVFIEWVRYHHYYLPLKTAPNCGENLFMELQKASQSQQIAAQSSGEMLAMSLVMILLLLA